MNDNHRLNGVKKEDRRLPRGKEADQIQAVDENEGKRNITRESRPILNADQRKVYSQTLRALNKSGITYAVGAAFARHAYTSIWRWTKDLDVFLMPHDLKKAMQALEEAGFETEIKDGHWLGKAWKNGYFIDLIFGTGHGQLPIDEDLFQGSQKAKILGVETYLVPPEEIIASAAYIAGRNRFDAGDIVHLIRSAEGNLDWQRILRRLDDNYELLLWHLLLFDFMYPGHSDFLPQDLMADLFKRVRKQWKTPEQNPKTFRGTLLDPYSYIVDIEDWGYEDRRKLDPLVDEEGEVL